MNTNARIFFGMLLAGASVTAVACSDSNDSGTTATTATTATTSTTGGTGGAGGMSGGLDCAKVCGDLYNCGLEKDGAAQLCPGFKGGAEANTFVKGTMDNGCEANCKDQPALAALVDPMNCKGTVGTLKGLNATFKSSCEEGLSSSAGAGGAGQGGAGQGGAGGN